jgi:hypothetical protein
VFVEKLLRDATNNALFNLTLITPEAFMIYIEQCRHVKSGRYLSKSLYGGKRSSLFHLFWLHNEIGFPEGFQAWLKVLYKGFFRNLTQGRTGVVAPHLLNDEAANNAGIDDERNVCQEGKQPMSTDLYRSLCCWFLEWAILKACSAIAFWY